MFGVAGGGSDVSPSLFVVDVSLSSLAGKREIGNRVDSYNPRSLSDIEMKGPPSHRRSGGAGLTDADR